MLKIKTNAMRILEQEKIPYEVTHYEVEDGNIDGLAVARKVNKAPEQVFKTLVTYGHSKENYVFLIPVTQELDLKKASCAAKEKNMDMLPLKDLQKTTGYIRGGCSPIGMKKLFKTYIHRSALTFENITLSGGKVGIQISLLSKDLKRLIRAEFADLIK